MSDQIIGRIDEMGSRIDELESSIGELMAQVSPRRPHSGGVCRSAASHAPDRTPPPLRSLLRARVCAGRRRGGDLW